MKFFIKKMFNSIMVGIALILVSFYAVVSFITFKQYNITNYSNFEYIIIVIIYMIVILILGKIFGGFKIGHHRIIEIIYFQCLSILIGNVIILMVLFLLLQGMYDFWPIIIMTIFESLFIIAWAFIGNRLYMKLNKPLKMVLVYGKNPKSIIGKMANRSDKYNICMVVKEGDFDVIKSICLEYDAVILYEIDENLKAKLFKFSFENNKSIYIIPSISDILGCNMEKNDLFDTPIFVSKNLGLSTEQRLCKRVLDLIIIIPISIVALPFMFITSIFIKLYDQGPILYKQTRLTTNGKEFYVYKFRSMKVNAEANSGARLATENDDRITPVGKVIRAIRFDELPQIFNILKGDMSVVGPRPERPEIAKTYVDIFPEFNYRLKVKAGLTGYAQVLGKYNTTPVDKVKLDLIYIQNYSLLLDLKLILMTIKILFMPESTEGVAEGTKLASDVLVDTKEEDYFGKE